MKLVDDDKELAQELLSTPGWRVILNTVFKEKIDLYARSIFDNARKAEPVACAVAVAKHDAMCEIIEAIYNAASYELPENLKALKRGKS